MSRVLAIDAGQSGIKVRSGDGIADLTFPGIQTGRALLPQLAEVVRASVAVQAVDVVAAGVSGLTDDNADADALLDLLDGTGVSTVILAHDSTTSFLGALGEGSGVVVAAGTGVVTLAVGPTRTARVDGWGWIMGDAGSGYWLGRAALDAVMRAVDGRGPVTTLTDVVQGRWPDLTQAYMLLQADPDRVRIVASFARAVAEAADAGDAVARDISERAARELAHSVRTGADRVRDEAGVLPVCAIGGVFASSTLREAFTVALADDRALTLVPPRGAGIDGALALADLSATHPLSPALHRSSPR
ncbi:BadF/BadG/BcrA/BcrD ATPase family protein [Microbacterium sp. NPDC079995]|uniref:BadF/BadG/BcrA/BcrD ATPase family protein n=1 Tax=unclassified Microbacterium TaxID=2609290 RepID=UPI00344FBC42